MNRYEKALGFNDYNPPRFYRLALPPNTLPRRCMAYCATTYTGCHTSFPHALLLGNQGITSLFYWAPDPRWRRVQEVPGEGTLLSSFLLNYRRAYAQTRATYSSVQKGWPHPISTEQLNIQNK